MVIRMLRQRMSSSAACSFAYCAQRGLATCLGSLHGDSSGNVQTPGLLLRERSTPVECRRTADEQPARLRSSRSPLRRCSEAAAHDDLAQDRRDVRSSFRGSRVARSMHDRNESKRRKARTARSSLNRVNVNGRACVRPKSLFDASGDIGGSLVCRIACLFDMRPSMAVTWRLVRRAQIHRSARCGTRHGLVDPVHGAWIRPGSNVGGDARHPEPVRSANQCFGTGGPGAAAAEAIPAWTGRPGRLLRDSVGDAARTCGGAPESTSVSSAAMARIDAVSERLSAGAPLGVSSNEKCRRSGSVETRARVPISVGPGGGDDQACRRQTRRVVDFGPPPVFGR